MANAPARSGATAQFVLDGQADPGRQRAVVGVRRPPDQFQQLGRKADRHGSAQPGGIPPSCRPVAPGSPAARRRRIPPQASSAWSSAVLPVLGGECLRSLIAADRAAPSRVPAIGWGQRHHEDAATDLGAHEPVRGRLGWVEQRAARPRIVDIIDPQVRMFEEVRDLSVDLERIFLVQRSGSNRSPFTQAWYYKRLHIILAAIGVSSPVELRM